LGIDQLTIEDTRHGRQRPKWEKYPSYVSLVLVTAGWAKRFMTLHERHRWLAAI
jgi:Mg2+ and Co2+ transporter CorA